jgi:hypothetical protein
MKRSILFILVIASFASCKKKPEEQEPPATIPPSGFIEGKGIFIINEGNYGFGNAKVCYYNYSTAVVTTDVFQSSNGHPLGDVCQSMKVINGKGFIVVNNSGKIEVVDMNSFKIDATITGFTSPRYILPVSASKAYVTDLYSNSIRIVDLNSLLITGSIPCQGWTEQMVKSGNNAYVTNQSKGKVYVVNCSTDLITDSIAVVKGANSIVLDKDNKLWVLCSGESGSVNGALYKIDPSNDQVEKTFPFSSGESPWRLSINGNKDSIYYLNKGVCRSGIGMSSLPGSVFIPEGSKNFYALGINPSNSEIYVADAIDYVQSGKVYVYSSSGTSINDFLAGIIPGDFCFY